MPKILPEEYKNTIGHWWVEVWKKDEDGKEYKTLEKIVKKNKIVKSFPALLAGLLSGESSFFGGILYHAFGEGLSSWDVSLPPPSFEDTTLTNEFYRIAPENITYYDKPSSESGVVVTNVYDASVILIKTVLDFGNSSSVFNNKFIRTHGLVGGDATSSLNSGLFIDIINNKAIYKTEEAKFVFYIEISL